MADIVIAHGAWSAGWAWKKMRPLMAARGHRLWTPTYTGLGERAHLASPEVDLDTHIADVLGVLEMEDLADVVLVGHSYGGMVATGVADSAPGRLQRVIYLDAFVPGDGESLAMLTGQEARHMRAMAEDGWRLPPRPVPADTPEEDRGWIAEARVGRRPEPVAPRGHQRPHLLPGPARRPGAVGDHDVGHLGLLPPQSSSLSAR